MRAFAILFALPFALACEEKSERAALAPAERSQVIEQKPSTAVTTQAATATAAAPSTPKPHRALCGGHLDAEGKNVPKRPLSRRTAASEPELTQDPAFGGGFTWVNFWAAWCVPCREEIPRLKSWQKKLTDGGKSFRLHFVSLDDDERQLQKFLDEQPTGGMRATYWLEEGKQREDWLGAVGVSTDPELPVHLLIDARGKVRCRVQGAVEDADYPDLVALLGG
jgi:thiol-disulfide isomerase/thioredoxin